MTMITPGLTILATLLTAALSAADAQQARSFVSGLGNDGNAPNCTRTAPCRTFQVAHDNTLTNGEITVLDAGSYGGLTITKNISIVNDGVGEAGALVSGGATGITINANAATDAVTLRGLTIKGIGFGGGTGIIFNSGLSLTLENCVIRNMTGAAPLGEGLRFIPNASSALAVSNTAVTDNVSGGIVLIPSGTGIVVNAVLERVGLYNNGFFGFALNAGHADPASRLNAGITNSVAGNNDGNAYQAFAPISGSAIANVYVTNSMAAGNLVGLAANGVALVIVGGSTIIANGTNLVTTGPGTVATWSNNYEFNNVVTNPFTAAIAPH